MPKVEGAPKALNDLLESVYSKAKADGKSEEDAAKSAWGAAKAAGWEKDASGKWTKSNSKMEGETNMEIKMTINDEASKALPNAVKRVEMEFISNAFILSESPKDEKFIARLKGIAVTPGIHNSAGGRLEITKDVIQASAGKWKGLPIVDVHNSDSLRAVLGEITKDEVNNKSELVYEAGVYNTAAGRDLVEVMKHFKKSGVSIGASGDVNDMEDDKGWYGQIAASGFTPMHLGVMQNGAQADKSAYAMAFKAAPESMQTLTFESSKMEGGKDMTEDEATKLASQTPEVIEAAKKKPTKDEEDAAEDAKDSGKDEKAEGEMQAKDKEISSLKTERDALAAKVAEGATALSKANDAIVASEKAKADLNAKIAEMSARLAELVAFKEGIDKEKVEAERQSALSECKNLAALVDDAEIKFEENSDLTTLKNVEAKLRDKIVKQAVAGKVSTRKAVQTTPPADSGKGSEAPRLPRFYSRGN